ncbi:MAG: DUF1801 domain-containing protein [Anaerolineales bacterium]
MNAAKQTTSDLPKIGAPATRALESIGITKLEQLTKVTEAELSQLHGFGPKALRILQEMLKANGLVFKTNDGKEVSTKKKASPVSRTDKVDEFMATLDHPLKAEVQRLRDIIKGANKGITEEIKWKAPSFSYKGEYLVTFNLRDMSRVHLVFHNPLLPQVKSKLLEGDYVDRRMAYFADMRDVEAKKPALQKVLKDLIKLIGK